MTRVQRSACVTMVLLSSAWQSSLAEESDQNSSLPTGEWSTECNAWGNDAKCYSSWFPSPIGGDLSVQKYEVRSLKDDSVLFAGRGVYKLSGELVEGHWEDSQGSLHPLSGSWRDGILTVYWGEPAATMGRSRYSFQERKLNVEDWSLTEKGWHSFMKVEYQEQIEVR